MFGDWASAGDDVGGVTEDCFGLFFDFGGLPTFLAMGGS